MFIGRDIDMKEFSPIQIQFDAYMRRTIKYTVAAFLKREKRELKRREAMLNIDDISDQIGTYDVRSDENGFELKMGHYSILFDSSCVADAFARLNDRQKAAIVLVYFFDMSYEQAAKVLNMAMGTFGKCLERAKRRVRSLILKKGEEEHEGE